MKQVPPKIFFDAFLDKIIKFEKNRVKKYPGFLLAQFYLIGHIHVQLFKTAIELNIPNLLASNKSMTLDELHSATKTNKEALQRLLRALNAMQIVNIGKRAGKYSLGKTGKIIIKNDQNLGLYNLSMIIGSEWYDSIKNITKVVKKGKNILPDKKYKSYWDYLNNNITSYNYFNNSMEELTNSIIPGILTDFKFENFKHIVDVAGGNGILLSTILSAYPYLKGTLFENKKNISISKKNNSLSKRCNFVVGDFFNSIPSGGDCYLLKNIIHDWSDENAIKILTNCNKAMKKGDTLLLIELTIDEIEYNWYKLYLDILLLTCIGGKERTIKQFKKLLNNTGFNFIKVIRTRSFMSIIEAKKK
jgi:hypothetical protein